MAERDSRLLLSEVCLARKRHLIINYIVIAFSPVLMVLLIFHNKGIITRTPSKVNIEIH